MEGLTVVIPFYNGHATIAAVVQDIPVEIPILIVDDLSDVALQPSFTTRPNVQIVRLERKGYFTGAVNYGLELTLDDVLVLNQDVRLAGTAWLDVLAENRKTYALIGERIRGNHPAFPEGYVHGVFQFMRRDAIHKAGLMDAVNYPLWGASALWQWQICRKGFKSLPLGTVPGLSHWHTEAKPAKRYGDSIQQLLAKEPENKGLYIRTPPAISVIVPCYNYGRYLPDCINSLIGGPTSLGYLPGQTFQSFEVIIVDDGSTDDTRVIAEGLASPWNGVRYLYQRNRGCPAANNTGIRAALGKYISILSADDMREPWSLDDLYQTAERNPNRVIYDEPVEFQKGKRGKKWPLAEYDFENMLERNMVPAGILFPRAAWERVGGYPEDFKHGREDWSFNVALGEAGYCGLKIERSGYLYRREQQNRTLRNTTAEWRAAFLIQMRKRFPHLYAGERPMACCGQSKRSRTDGSVGGARAMARSLVMPDGEMVLVEYTGASVGSKNWGGPGTVPSGRYYRFGSNQRDKVKYVEAQDVDWFVEHRSQGKSIFSLVTQPKREVKELGNTLVPTGNLTMKVQRIVDSPNPDELTVQQIRELDLQPEQWAVLLEKEQEGRGRTGVINYVKEWIERASTSA